MNVRDWLYVDDHCVGIYLTLTKGTPGEIYNIGGGAELTNLELTKKLLNFFERDESFIDFVPDRLGHDRRYSVDSAKIQKLGYRASQDFIGNLTKTVNSYFQSPKP
jgi:dTDP-glucose 4,6-dehydratase